ncbi:transposase [Streptomyces sp. NPDC004752]
MNLDGATVRLGPDDDLTEVTATQIRDLLARLREAGQWREGDPEVLFVLDSGYDIVRLTWLLRGEPVRLLGRIRADRVMYHPPGRRKGPTKGRGPRHGEAFRLADPATHPAPIQESATVHDRFGRVMARSWGHLHPRLERRQGGWADHPGALPIDDQLRHSTPRHSTTAGRRYLLPGQSPGRPRNLLGLADTLRHHGLSARAARNTAMMDALVDLPPMVIADLLGIHPKTAERWATLAGGNWSDYLAARRDTRRASNVPGGCRVSANLRHRTP